MERAKEGNMILHSAPDSLPLVQVEEICGRTAHFASVSVSCSSLIQ